MQKCNDFDKAQNQDAARLMCGEKSLSVWRGCGVYAVEIHISHVVGCNIWVWINHFPPNFKKWLLLGPGAL